ncbi:hypothetical protein [Clostridium sp. ZS1]|uniref:hypothetical protein n=1 Tax=Clostridium sp. ZS1 TaxID=2949989 RepID=UPI00207A74F6|nr:hypothetical protein [Clostridium sp. ZS1]
MLKKGFGIAIAMMNFFDKYGASKQWGKAIFWTSILVAAAYIFDWLIRSILFIKGEEIEKAKLLGDAGGVVISLGLWCIFNKLGITDFISNSIFSV